VPFDAGLALACAGLVGPKDNFDKELAKLARKKAKRDAKAAKKRGDLIPWLTGFEFSFLDAKKFRESGENFVRHQEIQGREGWLIKHRISIKDIVEGNMKQHAAAFSYCWGSADHPDPTGSQAAALRCFLWAHPEITMVFVDYSCLPQASRTEEEDLVFKESLKNINMVYLACSVICAVSRSYFERFWPQYEGFLGCQTVGEDGLNLVTDPNGRRSVVIFENFEDKQPESIHRRSAFSSPQELATEAQRSQSMDQSKVDKSETDLQEEFGRKCAVGAKEIMKTLSNPNTKVTTGGDKTVQLAKLVEVKEMVAEAALKLRESRQTRRS
jgi:hypothetical protein